MTNNKLLWKWQRLDDSCTGCGICVDVCPDNALKMTIEMSLPTPIETACTGCKTCVNECPFDAISLSLQQNTQ